MSGHSKWSNIKNKKGKTDAARSKVFSKMAKYIAVAAREGGPDPEMNSKLREAVAKAKAANMPNDNIERAIKRGSGEMGNSVFEEITYEGYGPSGVAVIVSALTDNKNRTAADVRHTFDKCGGNLGTNGCVNYLFNTVGQILVEKEGIDEDEFLMEMLDAGAEDIDTTEDGFEIKTDPNDFITIMDKLEEMEIKPVSGEVAQIPTTYVTLKSDDTSKMQRMLDMFEDNDDVQNVWHNWDF